MRDELPVERLRSRCDPSALGCTTSQEARGLETIIGQDRAVKSLRFGLGIQDVGFNIYVSGMPGTGRTTAVKGFLEEVARDRPVPDEWCYVTNFRDSSRPKALRLPRMQARQLRADMKGLVAGARRDVRNAFESEEYGTRRQEVAQAFERQKEEMFTQLSEHARQEGFVIQASTVGLMTVPVKEGQPLTEEQFVALGEEEKAAILEKRDKLGGVIEATLRRSKRVEKSAGEALQKLDHDVALYALSHLIQDLKEKYQGLPDAVAYLNFVQEDMLENLDQFRPETEEQASSAPWKAEPPDGAWRKYEVNALVDSADLKGAPVVIELNPTHSNVFGRIEQESVYGALVTDLTLIREGAIHRANGGYLVLPAEELLRNAFTWDTLKRALANRQIAVEDVSEQMGVVTTKTLRPEPIPLSVKVILIGQPETYYLLRAYDEQFSELFKVKADFDTRMDRTADSERGYAAFVCAVCENEELRHLDRSALARLVEHGSRLVEDQEKLSTRFGEIADIIREASYYTTQENVPLVSDVHIKKAIEERFYRSNLIVERFQEMIQRGTILIDVTGAKVGQVNGLSVVDMGDISFGQPSRITASIALGREGLMDIEREARMGGPIHTKGVLILSGYLAEKFAQDKPLSVTARLVFEQSYGGVEGDSASSTELYALLSSLSDLPIKQGIAVTGSVNQKGEVQAIGGVNDKIEGFFEVCKAKGLTGEQGVMIPETNVPNLMLKDAVVDAVRQGQFHVWPVRSIDEGIELLTGVAAGARQEDGSFPEGTVSSQVDRRLRELAEALVEFGEKDEEGKGESADEALSEAQG